MKKAKAFVIVATVMISLLIAPMQTSALLPQSLQPDELGNEIIGIAPYWENVSRINMTLSSSNNTASADVSIFGMTGTTSINATITLSRVNSNGTLTTVRTWSNQSSSSSLFTFSGTNAITSGNTYRLSVSATVIRNGVSETVSDWTERRL